MICKFQYNQGSNKTKQLAKMLFYSTMTVLLFSCTQLTPDKPYQRIKVLKSNQFEQYDSTKHEVAHFIEDYFNIMHDSSAQIRNNIWNSKIFYTNQDRMLHSSVKKEYLLKHPPKILAIRSVEDYFIAKLAYEDSSGFTTKIMNLKLRKDPFNRFYFQDLLSENLETFEKHTVKSYEFYYSKKTERDSLGELETIQFSKKMAEWFSRPEKKLRVIIVKDYDDYTQTQGYDYLQISSQDLNTGGLAAPNEDLYFSQNGKPFYAHEIVHCYSDLLEDYFWFDEGLATYFGGSVGYPLEFHLNVLARNMDTLDFSKIPKDKGVEKTTTFKYSIGGLFVKLAMEEYGGKETILKLMNYGKEEEDFHAAIKDVFGLKKEDYDSFIRKKLEKYKEVMAN